MQDLTKLTICLLGKLIGKLLPSPSDVKVEETVQVLTAETQLMTVMSRLRDPAEVVNINAKALKTMSTWRVFPASRSAHSTTTRMRKIGHQRRVSVHVNTMLRMMRATWTTTRRP
jgi:hypothetical protein